MVLSDFIVITKLYLLHLLVPEMLPAFVNLLSAFFPQSCSFDLVSLFVAYLLDYIFPVYHERREGSPPLPPDFERT